LIVIFLLISDAMVVIEQDFVSPNCTGDPFQTTIWDDSCSAEGVSRQYICNTNGTIINLYVYILSNCTGDNISESFNSGACFTDLDTGTRYTCSTKEVLSSIFLTFVPFFLACVFTFV